MNVESFEECLRLVQEFLATKKRENSYRIRSIQEGTGHEHTWIEPLTDEQVARIRELKEFYGEYFVRHLDEVFPDPDVIYELSYGEEIQDIDLDNVLHEYRIAIHELLPDGTTVSHPYKIELSDEQYVELVALHLFDNDFTVNLLRFRDRSLYDAVMLGVDGFFWNLDDTLEVSNPYLPTLDEAKADAEMILEKNNITRVKGRRKVFMNDVGNPDNIFIATKTLFIG